MDFIFTSLVSFWCSFLVCTATPTTITHHEPTSFTIDTVKTEKPASKKKLGATAWIEVPEKTLVRMEYAFRFKDAQGNIVEQPITKAEYDAWAVEKLPQKKDGYTYFGAVGNRKIYATTTLKNGEYRQLQKASATGTDLFLIKEPGKAEKIVTTLP